MGSVPSVFLRSDRPRFFCAGILALLATFARTLRADASEEGRFGASARDFTVAIQVRASEPRYGQRRTLALLSFSLPFDTLLARAPRQGVRSAAGLADSSGSSPRGQRAGRQRAKLAIVADPRLARDTVGAALRAARLAAGDEELGSLVTRARASAALPDLRLRGGRSTDESLRLTPTVEEPYRYTQAGSAEVFFEVQLAWKLGRLVFSTTELRVEELRRRRARARAGLVEHVLETLFAWQRARAGRDDPALLPEEQAELVLLELESHARLDVLTAGWFSRRVPQ